MISAATRKSVLLRAANRCEYSKRHQADSPLIGLQVEHVLPRKHGGGDELDNLAAACIDCNLRKGANLSGIDPETGLLTRLFHPRLDQWETHFSWEGVEVIGLSAVGRTTIRVLDLNSSDRTDVRIWATNPGNKRD